MCLKIGERDFCTILRRAPRFVHRGEDRSLEFWQHQIEENHVEHSPEMLQAIATACGLTIDEYRERTAHLRGENVLKQIEYSRGSPEMIGTYQPFFSFSRDLGTWVAGETHRYPGVDWIADDDAETAKEKFSEFRYRMFKRRFSREPGDYFGIWRYPERVVWVARLQTDLRSVTKPTKRERMMLALRKWDLDITTEMRFTEPEIDLVIEARRRCITTVICEPDKTILREVLSSTDLEVLELFMRRRSNLTKSGKNRSRRWRKRSWSAFDADLSKWKREVWSQYDAEYSRRLREYLMNNHLIETPALAEAA